MQLQELFEKLSYGELSSLALGSGGDGRIDQGSYGKVTQAANEALLALYTRFILSEKEVIIQTLDWKANYQLHPRHSFLNVDENDDSPRYIADAPHDRFDGRLIKILGVTNEIGQFLPLNDPEQYASVFTPQFDTIQITHPGFTQAFSINYQSAHKQLLQPNSFEAEGFLEQDVVIPPTLEEALLKKIAEKIYSPMSGQDNSNKATLLENQYEFKCREVEEKNLLGESNPSTNVKLYRRGFR